jgi:dsRNA-specific ribonuclease
MPPKFNTRHASALGSSSLALHKEAHTNGPPLPKINVDLWQEVYTHRSVARAKPHDEVGDNLRLAILGGEIMRLIITWCLFEKKPHLSAQEIEKSRDEYLLPGNIDSWVNAYNMKVNVRASSSEMLQSLEGDTV